MCAHAVMTGYCSLFRRLLSNSKGEDEEEAEGPAKIIKTEPGQFL